MSENQSPRFMLMFTIGPVQSFIEASRKTEDLWMGSYIFSYLIATAMEKVQGDGVELIYPAIGSKPPFEFWKEHDFATPSIPNLFLAIGDGTLSQDDLVKRAGDAESEVNTVFEQMAKRVLDKAFGPWRNSYVKDLYKKQISGFFDIYWVITEEEIGQEYGKWYAHTAGSLAAIKNCRTFKPMEEIGRKCSLDGIREILHKKETESIDAAMKWWENFAKVNPRHCRQKEALCAVSLTKRMGMHYLENYSKFKDEFTDDRPRFPSTSEIATAAFKEQLRCKPNALGVYAEFVKAVKKLKDMNNRNADIPYILPLPKSADFLERNIDGEWLYEETCSASYLERYYNIGWANQQRQIEYCENLRKKLVGLIEGEPGKYYAAIALDADNMGEVNRNTKDREQHKANSTKLIEFTKDAQRIVEEEHLGKLTYAGGDDLLALANLSDLLPILKKLRKAFPDFTSASAGVCIAHNKMPLNNVIRHARRMEKEAKKEDGKDALGIALFKHSGNISEMVTKWEYRDMKVLTIGMELIGLLDDDEISKRFLYTFREAFTKLMGDDGKLVKGLPPALVTEEFTRLIERAYKTKEQELDTAKQKTISETIALLPPCISPFTDYLSFLEIINFIARESK